MTKKRKRIHASKSRLLVIDACVLRASGSEGATHPTPKQCRDLLMAVLEICHRAALNEHLKEEWHNHSSRFARRWRQSMYARGKILEPKRSSSAISVRIENNISSLSERDTTAVEKDLHLLDAAFSADKIVISLDDTMKGLVQKIGVGEPDLAKLIWINPTVNHNEVIKWLLDGETSLPSWFIGISADKIENASRRRPSGSTRKKNI